MFTYNFLSILAKVTIDQIVKYSITKFSNIVGENVRQIKTYTEYIFSQLCLRCTKDPPRSNTRENNAARFMVLDTPLKHSEMSVYEDNTRIIVTTSERTVWVIEKQYRSHLKDIYGLICNFNQL